MFDDLIGKSPFEQSLETLNETEDHHPEPPDVPADRVLRLIFNFDVAQTGLQEATDLAADLENAGREIKTAWEDGRLPQGCDVFGLIPASVEVTIEKI